MWFDEKEQKLLNDDQLFSLLTEIKDQIVLLEGPTGCGKSRMLNRLNRDSGRRTLILAEDRFVRAMLADISAGEGGKPFPELAEGFDVICIEDIDLLSGKEYTQEAAAQRLSETSKGALVIAAGIRLNERVNTLIERLDVPARLIVYRDGEK